MRGIDVSNLQGAIDWDRVARVGGIKFAFVKATEGRTFNDSRFRENVAAARKAGVKVGAYHFARPDNNGARVEARHFLDVIAGVELDLLPVLDWETRAGLTPGQMVEWAADWLEAVRRELGVRPFLYTYPSFWTHDCGDSKSLNDFPLWLASYGPNDGVLHPARVVGGWKTIAIQQFTSNGSVPGIRGRVDMNWATELDPYLLHRPNPTPAPTPAPSPKEEDMPEWLPAALRWYLTGHDPDTRPDGVPADLPAEFWPVVEAALGAHVELGPPVQYQAFRDWRVIDGGTPDTRPAGLPVSIPSRWWTGAEHDHEIASKFAEAKMAPLRDELAKAEHAAEDMSVEAGTLRQRIADAATKLSEVIAALKAPSS